MYIVASTEVNESFPDGSSYDLELNQTLANYTGDDLLSCFYEHIHALVIIDLNCEVMPCFYHTIAHLFSDEFLGMSTDTR
jgi:hypothetical protein